MSIYDASSKHEKDRLNVDFAPLEIFCGRPRPQSWACLFHRM